MLESIRHSEFNRRKEGGEVNNTPALLIKFDPIIWKPMGVFPITDSDMEADRLRKIAARMLEAIEKAACYETL